jgi:hypothetical protein
LRLGMLRFLRALLQKGDERRSRRQLRVVRRRTWRGLAAGAACI